MAITSTLIPAVVAHIAVAHIVASLCKPYLVTYVLANLLVITCMLLHYAPLRLLETQSSILEITRLLLMQTGSALVASLVSGWVRTDSWLPGNWLDLAVYAHWNVVAPKFMGLECEVIRTILGLIVTGAWNVVEVLKVCLFNVSLVKGLLSARSRLISALALFNSLAKNQRSWTNNPWDKTRLFLS